ncbi:MAG: flagellar basal body-associated FliL family protein [Candidatus Gastranaerophilales bacterium]|nr:flagellar basal body-associated FliL family protein [Candidatus Gastranaerophilales bacterium]
MARPTENKEDKNPNEKAFEMSPSLIMMISNGIMLLVIIVSLFVMNVSLKSSIDEKFALLSGSQEQGEMEEDGEIRQEGVLLDLGDFILNLADTAHRRYLKVGIAMELSKTQEEVEAAQAAANAKSSGGHGHGSTSVVDPNAEIAIVMERYKPAIRDAIISVLSNKTSDELSTPTGKEIAKEEILEMVNNIFEGQREVMRVSFGQFIIQ